MKEQADGSFNIIAADAPRHSFGVAVARPETFNEQVGYYTHFDVTLEGEGNGCSLELMGANSSDIEGVYPTFAGLAVSKLGSTARSRSG